MKESTKLDIYKSAVNAVVTWLIFGMILSIINHAALAQSLLSIHTIILAITAGLGSYVGFLRRELHENAYNTR